MRKRHLEFGCLPFLKVVSVAAVASLTTACSSDAARFSDTPFANPFQGRIDSAATNAVSKRISSSALVPSQALPGKTGQTLVGAAAKAVPSPVSGGVAGWSTSGGTPITVGTGDTIDAISNRYGVPVSALRAANGLNGGQPSVGQKLIIPSYSPGSAVAKVAANGPTYTPVAEKAPAAKVERKPRYESLTQAQPAKAPAAPKAERKPRYESLQTAAAAPKAKASDDEDDRPVAKKVAPKVVKAQPAKPVAATPKVAQKGDLTGSNKKVTKVSVKQAVDDDDDQPMPPKPKAPIKAPTKVATAPVPKVAAEKAETEAAKAPETTASTPENEFRWPARGRVISGYGSKGPSGSNDGINIAVPEGTPVKASEAGTVAYAGEEIKGYGKMVLIRHPNGYVSAYAHNGDLNVKRGDVVKRGQQIAKSGQSGNVTSPQLHFELRKGSDPVDPAKYLD